MPIQTPEQQEFKKRKEEHKEFQQFQSEQRKKIVEDERTKITAKELWEKLDEIQAIVNSNTDKLIKIEMYFENLQEYINKTGKLEILNKSDKYK